MDKVMETLPVSELRSRQAHVLKRLKKGPVLLTQRGRGAGVLVDPALWNEIMDTLLEFEDIIVAQERMIEARTKPDVMQPLSALRTKLQDDGLIAP